MLFCNIDATVFEYSVKTTTFLSR